jgi:hypothetical protein
MSITREFLAIAFWVIGGLLRTAGVLAGCQSDFPSSITHTVPAVSPGDMQVRPATKAGEQRAATEAGRLGETRRLDPNGAEYLARVTPRAKESAKAASGTTVRLTNQLSIAEAPDYDPFQDLGKIKLSWRQTAGPPVQILDADSPQARALMPIVDGPTPLVFVVEASNTSGKRQAELTIMVHPRVRK